MAERECDDWDLPFLSDEDMAVSFKNEDPAQRGTHEGSREGPRWVCGRKQVGEEARLPEAKEYLEGMSVAGDAWVLVRCEEQVKGAGVHRILGRQRNVTNSRRRRKTCADS